LWRHNEEGDLPGHGEEIDAKALGALVRANEGRHGYTYTHKGTSARNLGEIAKANAGGFTVNLSANGLRHADQLLETKAGPVCAVVTSEVKRNGKTPGGNRFVVCPAAVRDDMTCARCGICARRDRAFIVAFPAHGQEAAAVNRIVGNLDSN
jgi:hypothetical protein